MSVPTAAPSITPVAGGVCAPRGLRAAGITAGLKPSGAADLALVAADGPAVAVGVQTRNQAPAAPVQLTERHLADGRARAVLLNAGSANAATGPDGLALAAEAAAAVGQALGCPAEEVLVCSTGVIGAPIPRAPYLGGIPVVVAALSADGGSAAAQAVLTTDTVRKERAVAVIDDRGACTIGGMVKGSGMIAPSLATMLCVLTTDVDLAAPQLDAALRHAVTRTFERISVDDCMSTNDAVLLLATGRAPGPPPDPAAFTTALTALCDDLATDVVRDGEGASVLLSVRVVAARTEEDAVAVGRQVAGSALVRTALAGRDPNWGRVLAAVGAGHVPVDPARVGIAFGDVVVAEQGVATGVSAADAAAAMTGGAVTCTIDLGLGDATAVFRTCDLGHGYVTINAEYTT